MKTHLQKLLAASAALVWLSTINYQLSTAFAQGTAFTYQGQLLNGGAVATGLYDLQFSLYTSSSGGSASFGPVSASATPVTNGLFTVTIDFGTGVFNGTTYWLDISVRTNGGGTFTELSPRQQLTPNPYAVYSPNAGSANSVAAANITGTISLGQLPTAVVTNNDSSVTLNGSFGGNGSGMTNMPLSGLADDGGLALATNGLGFALTATLTAGTAPVFVTAVTNLNGAGHVDLVSASVQDNTLSVWTNNGSGVFARGALLNVSTNPLWVAVLDVNNDGRPDLVCGYLDTNNFITVLTNNGAGGFGSNATLTVGLQPTCVIAADVNGDGKPDLITANFGTNTLTVLTNNRNGGFGLSATLRVGTNPVEVAAADLIGNGKQDLISANYGTNTLSVLINNGNGTFLPTTYTVGNIPRSVLAFDVNGDGLPDLVCLNQGDLTLTVLTNNGDGTFTTASTDPVVANGLVNNISAADVNGDGRLDVIVACDVGLEILLNTGNGTFASPIVLTPNVPTPGIYSVAAADVNGDGKPDLVGAAFNTDVLAELINVMGEVSSELTMAGQSGGLRLEAGLNDVPDIIGGSSANIIDPGLDGSVIAGGGSAANYNRISSTQSVISGGEGNQIESSSDHSAIGGGFGNTVLTNSSYSVIGGGYSNTVSGPYATVPGGSFNLASGANSLAAGNHAQATNIGSFVWADSTGGTFGSTANDTFDVRAFGGIQLVTGSSGVYFDNSGGTISITADSFGPAIVVNTSGGFLSVHRELQILPNLANTQGGYFQVLGTGTNFIQLDGQSGNITNTGSVFAHGVQLTSDRNAKENFVPVDLQAVLDKVATLPMTEWNFKGDASGERHIGPMAQDFHAAFYLNGADDKHISVVDEGGVALAAIQGLNQKVEAGDRQSEARIQKLEAENAELKARLEKLEQRLGH